MSELTKFAEIITRNLGNALLAMASEFSKLNTPSPLSQASETPKNESIIAKVPWKRFTYNPRDKVIVQFKGSTFPTKCRILKRVSESEYLVYPQQGLKADARTVAIADILGLDPDR
jgi:hypothetical protein